MQPYTTPLTRLLDLNLHYIPSWFHNSMFADSPQLVFICHRATFSFVCPMQPPGPNPVNNTESDRIHEFAHIPFSDSDFPFPIHRQETRGGVIKSVHLPVLVFSLCPSLCIGWSVDMNIYIYSQSLHNPVIPDIFAVYYAFLRSILSACAVLYTSPLTPVGSMSKLL